MNFYDKAYPCQDKRDLIYHKRCWFRRDYDCARRAKTKLKLFIRSIVLGSLQRPLSGAAPTRKPAGTEEEDLSSQPPCCAAESVLGFRFINQGGYFLLRQPWLWMKSNWSNFSKCFLSICDCSVFTVLVLGILPGLQI